MKKTIVLRSLAMFVCAMSMCNQSSHAKDQQIQLSDEAAISFFYEKRNGEAYWLENGEFSKNAIQLVEVIENSWENGFNPNVYHYHEIKHIRDHLKFDQNTQFQLEMILTDAFAKYVKDLSGMRVRASDVNLIKDQWKQSISISDALSYLDKKISNMDEFLMSLEPQSKSYQMLKDEMRKLVLEYKEGEIEKVNFQSVLKPGQGAKDIPKLRSRFGLDSPAGDQKYLYDSELVAAVKNFQLDKGLKSDGIIGHKTLEMFNLSKEQKIKKLIVNLERLRWIKNNDVSTFMVVNIPASRLLGVENGVVQVDMPVVVGRKKRETLSFVTDIHGVRFNPTWTVPPTIRKEDILPKLKEDPLFLSDKGMEIFKKTEEGTFTVDPASVDWLTVTENDLSQYKMVQKAGDNNPLGRIRILMPNMYNIYLHDTNHPELFDRSDLAQSSGCVRLKHPDKVANFVLKNLKGWSEEKMLNIIKSGKTKDFYIENKIPIYLVYNTVWIGEKDQVIYGNDIYELDQKLLNLIEKADGYKISSHSENMIAISLN